MLAKWLAHSNSSINISFCGYYFLKTNTVHSSLASEKEGVCESCHSLKPEKSSFGRPNSPHPFSNLGPPTSWTPAEISRGQYSCPRKCPNSVPELKQKERQQVSAGSVRARGATSARREEASLGGTPKVTAMEARGCARSRRPLPALLLILLLLLLPPAAGAAGAADARWSGQGTTPHLQSIFLGRCAEYIAVLSPELR